VLPTCPNQPLALPTGLVCLFASLLTNLLPALLLPPTLTAPAFHAACPHPQAVAKDVPEAELERAKAAAVSSVLMNLESRAVVAEDIGRQVLTYGHRCGRSSCAASQLKAECQSWQLRLAAAADGTAVLWCGTRSALPPAASWRRGPLHSVLAHPANPELPGPVPLPVPLYCLQEARC
jgi:hypothetical protein